MLKYNFTLFSRAYSGKESRMKLSWIDAVESRDGNNWFTEHAATWLDIYWSRPGKIADHRHYQLRGKSLDSFLFADHQGKPQRADKQGSENKDSMISSNRHST